MKKYILFLGLVTFQVGSIYAQNKKGAKIITLPQTVSPSGIGGTTQFQIQIGIPIIGIKQQLNLRTFRPIDLRTPWDVLYSYDTFSEDYFTISKGYYGDKVKLEWEVKAHTVGQSAVTGIKIYRRIYNPNNQTSWGQPIGVLPSNATSFEDKYVDGGVLYEYKVYASGVLDLESKYKNYITGIGFRSPTAIVTGNVNFKGGNPVKDVVLVASSNNVTSNPNKSLKIPSSSFIQIINNSGNNIDSASTLQAWVKPFEPYVDDIGQPINLFKLYSNTNIEKIINVSVNYKVQSKLLEINVGGTIFKLKNYFPSGNTNTRGDDELIPVSEFNSRFTNISAVFKNNKIPTLYVNGRPISVKYGNDLDSITKSSKIIAYNAPYFNVEITNETNIDFKSSSNWNYINIGGENTAIVDEIRIWKKALDTSTIRTDFKRYISGNNSSLVSYLNLNEGAGNYAYDLSKTGFVYNENNGALDDGIAWLNGEGNVPTSDQLGILGVTDEKGNYEITNIPYTGVGESYTITPMYGQHKFEAKQQLVYLGQGSEVANKIDFTDVSSFKFKGVVIYDSRGVFPSFVDLNNSSSTPIVLTEGDQIVHAPIIDEGYNYYQKGSLKYNKGEYWLNNAGTTDNLNDDYLERYARIYVKGANVYVDGNIVLDENNMPVETDVEGRFDVSVPIGNHAIYVKKDGHTLYYNGRYPGTIGTFKEFFENAEEPVFFVDTTKVEIVGKVVGGATEASKKIGFGENGFLFRTIQDSLTKQNKIVEISAKNNIGVAKLTMGYKPNGGDVTDVTKTSFSTNLKSGEYRVKLLPLLYELKSENLVINSNNSLAILPINSTETIDFSKIPALVTPIFKYKESSTKDSVVYATGKPYHYEKSFIYRTTPILEVLKQTSDEKITINGIELPIAVKPDTLVYTQLSSYNIELKRYEKYFNKDTLPNKQFDVPVSDGVLIETNNLAIPSTVKTTIDDIDPSILKYTFKAGVPSIDVPFTKTISLQYRVNNIDYNVIGLKSNGIILGGASDGSQTFVTDAPNIPALILRDPPGTNSSAQITQGTSYTVNTSHSFTDSEMGEFRKQFDLGFETTISGGMFPIPETKIEVTSENEVGISLKTYSTDGRTTTNTYTFNKTISTSSQSDFVGSDGDLYIGNSKNIYYGTYDNVMASTRIPVVFSNGISVTMNSSDYINIGTSSSPVYVSKQKGISFNEKPTSTFFIYSQKHILTTLIPEYQNFITTSLNSSAPDTTKINRYKEQIRIWRSVILDNEKKKYLAKNYRNRYKSEILKASIRYESELKKAYSSADPVSKDKINSRLNYTDSVQANLDNRFEKNISFDAGLGVYNESIETNTLLSSNFSYNVDFKTDFKSKIGVKLNGSGTEFEVKGEFEIDNGYSITQDLSNSSNISFSIIDNDPSNYISFDVINAFDGNGPIFSTLGGRTSCPYEGSETSKFFPEEKFKSYFDQLFAINDGIDIINTEIDNLQTSNSRKIILSKNKMDKKDQIQILDDSFASDFDKYFNSEKALLSFATQKIEAPVLSVTKNNVVNVPDGKNAEFELKLNNNSAAGTDATFRLRIDNTSNPNNAITNIEKNGSLVNVPYGKTTIFKMTLAKSIADVYDYDNIKVILESLCDGEAVSSSVVVSAKFVPACTSVTVTAPADNWVYNRESAYNLDKTTKPLLINISGYNTSFSNFKQIDLEYRRSGTPNWTRLQTYYNSTGFYDASPFTSDKMLIGASSSLNHSFSIADLSLSDGNYEIRARSTCTNGTEFISDVNIGKVDLILPQKFGTPTPIDGILGIGEDLKVVFNEPIFYNSAVSLVEIKGQTNQMKIDHNVSAYFSGAENTAVITSPKIANGDITLEFWMKNANSNDATILQQKDGISIKIASGNIVFNIANVSVSGLLPIDNLFHHYSFLYNQNTGGVSMYLDDKTLGSNSASTHFPISNNESIIIGGNTFAGNIHDVRIWNKVISLADAYAKMYNKLSGNEANLVGYWPMTEGTGTIAFDNARFKHATLNANMWDIKPKGSSYSFANNQYLKIDHAANAIITNEMDATVTFWMKTNTTTVSTLLSNGRGDSTDVNQGGGFDNKWAIQLNSNGNLVLNSEGNQYPLTTSSVADNAWHHVALLFNRQGSLKTYIDAKQVSSNPITKIGGFSGNTVWIGARGYQDMAGIETIDQKYSGKIDEVQIWNTLRTEDQIFRDRYFEIAPESIGLLLYSKLNQPDVTETVSNTDGPRYFVYSSNGPVPYRAILSSGTTTYSTDAPAIKPERTLINFLVNSVINNNEMILTPSVSDAASIEGQTLDITVNRMFDGANNMQSSPITWTAYYRRNDVMWYADGYNDIVDIVKYVGDLKTFDIVVLNKGGVKRSYNISNIPRWLSLSSTSGTIAPNSKIIITATIDKDYATGEFIENMNLGSEFGYDEKLQVKLRILAKDPNWSVTPSNFNYSMNVVGRLKLNGIFTSDIYNQIAAFKNDTVVGVAKMVYNEAYGQYYTYLTIYSNNNSGDIITFKAWDANEGKIKELTFNSALSLNFIDNDIYGSLSNPIIFENTTLVEQNITINKGWTWISMSVNDPNFKNINSLTSKLVLETGDRIINGSSQEIYSKNISPFTWSGSISANGGLSASKMYKLYIANPQTLTIKGSFMDVANWTFPLNVNWNWLPYPLPANRLTSDALAYFDATDGDIIKSQTQFAMYDSKLGWNGTLKYLEPGKGYMIKSAKSQSFTFPKYLSKTLSIGLPKDSIWRVGQTSNTFTTNAENSKVTNSIISVSEGIEIPKEFVITNFSNYTQNMNAIMLLPDNFNELQVFDDQNHLKGIAKRESLNGLTYLTIFGDKPQRLQFFVNDGAVLKKVTYSTTFGSNEVLGTVINPIVLSLGEEDVFKTYPNPFVNEFSIEINTKKAQKATISIYSLSSQVLFNQEVDLINGTNIRKINFDAIDGVYLLKLQIGDQNYLRTIIKAAH